VGHGPQAPESDAADDADSRRPATFVVHDPDLLHRDEAAAHHAIDLGQDALQTRLRVHDFDDER
jgi:hypothetical protein